MTNYKLSVDSLPVILVENFLVPTEDDKKSIIFNIFKSKKKYNDLCEEKKNFYSYVIENDYNLFLKKLYNNYLRFCFKVFGHFSISKQNSHLCWAYCSNSSDYNSYWHDHTKTSTINSVYYINVPENSGGPILFKDSKDNLFSYHPKNYDLIVFPNYLEHKPNPPTSEEYRIAINMEIICNDISSNDIFKKVFPYLNDAKRI